MNYIDLKYARLVSVYLDGYKEVGNGTYNFRCPYCGDSQRSQTLARGYFFSIENAAVFKCHNCGKSCGLAGFLRDIAPSLYADYRLDTFRDANPSSFRDDREQFVTETATKFKDRGSTVLSDCQAIMSLPYDHYARAYLRARMIPEHHQQRLYYVDDCRLLMDRIGYDRDKNMPAKSAIVIPFRDKAGVLQYVQCRFFSGTFRYMTLDVAAGSHKIWGLDMVVPDKPVYVFEGAFDAMFVQNGIAVAGVSMMSAIKYIREQIDNDLILVFDADYRTNPDVYNVLCEAVNGGHKVVLFDEWFQGKDVNEQVVDFGSTPVEIEDYLYRRTFYGLSAKLELTKIRHKRKNKYGGYKKSQAEKGTKESRSRGVF